MVVTRNGHILSSLFTVRDGKEVRMSSEEYKAWLAQERAKNADLIDTYGSIILDCELTPWSAIGRSLISRGFDTYAACVQEELNQLWATAPKGDPFGARAFSSQKRPRLDAFEKALSRYRRPGLPELCPFDLLWAEKGDLPADPQSRFDLVKSKTTRLPTLSVSGYISDPNFVEELTRVYALLTGKQHMEGMVLKPFEQGPGIPAYMKVRSEEYLHLVYGYDYLDPQRYERLVRQKNITSKVQVSIREHALGQAMLNAKTFEELQEAAAKLIGEKRREATLDPRL